MSPYVLSKWGVRALARQLQIENRDLRHVHIAYVAPGGVDTPIYQQAANYDGYAGRPPVVAPERVAAVALKRVSHPRPRTQVGLSNDVIRLGFSTLPWAYDALIDPLFRALGTDRLTQVGATAGNVLQSSFAGNRLYGDQAKAAVGVTRNLVAATRGVAQLVKCSLT